MLSESHVSLMSHQFHTQRMSTGMGLLSEAPVTMTPIHVCSECPPTQRCHPRSSVSHCPVSVSCIQQCPLNGAARLDHQSSTTSHPQCFTHTHTKCTMRNATAIRDHHQSLPSLSFMHTAMSTEWGCQAGSPKHHHLSSTMFHTHTHTHTHTPSAQ